MLTPELVRYEAHKREAPEPANELALLTTLKNHIRVHKYTYIFLLLYFVSKISELNVKYALKYS